jgi:hypothetical protein
LGSRPGRWSSSRPQSKHARRFVLKAVRVKGGLWLVTRVSSTDTSACYHLVTLHSCQILCEFEWHIGMLSSCDSSLVWVRMTHRHAIILWLVTRVS